MVFGGLWMVFGGLWIIFGGLSWFLVAYHGFLVAYHGFWWFTIVFGGLWMFMGVYGCLWWFDHGVSWLMMMHDCVFFCFFVDIFDPHSKNLGFLPQHQMWRAP